MPLGARRVIAALLFNSWLISIVGIYRNEGASCTLTEAGLSRWIIVVKLLLASSYFVLGFSLPGFFKCRLLESCKDQANLRDILISLRFKSLNGFLVTYMITFLYMPRP